MNSYGKGLKFKNYGYLVLLSNVLVIDVVFGVFLVIVYM